MDEEGRRASQRAHEAGHHDLADELESREAGHVSAPSHRSDHERLSIKELVGLVQGTPEAVSALIAAGRVGAIDAKGDTPLHICASQGRLQFCDQLIKAGADPAAMNFEYKKPHDRAAENGHSMVAGLLQSLLPESFVAPYARPHVSTASPPLSEPVKEASDDIFAFDDLNLDFDGEEEAEDFHREIERDDYVASFDAVQGRVTRLGEEDGAELELDDVRRGGFRIDAEDVVGPLPQTAEFADRATFRSYLDVRTGRKSAPHATAPTTRFHAVSESALVAWVERVLAAGTCTGEDVDTLIGDVRGFFDAETVRGNLVHELTNVGLMPCEDESCDVFAAGYPPEPEDLVDLLACICNGSNMRPGMEFKPLSARAEARLFRNLSSSQQDICRALVSNETLVSVVVMLGEKVEAGSVPPSLLTDLDVQYGRQTPDGEILSASLSCLVGYQTMLEDGAVTAEHRAYALSAVSALKLSRDAVDLITQGLQTNPDLDDVRHQIETSLSAWEHYRREILLEHLSLVRRQACRREAHVEDIEDLVHDGVFGLMRSIDLFEPERGNRFMTYCQFGVRQSIARALDATGSLVRVPSNRAIVLRRVDRLEESISQQLSTEAIISMISAEMEIPAETIRNIRRIPRIPVPFEEMVHDCLDVDSPQFRHVLARQRNEIIEHFLADMPERAADVIVRRFGLRGEDEMTLEELGAIYGVTRERIRQIEAKRLAEIGHRAHRRLLRNLF
ncbi:sigma-70 family RNA polymerase sigma factor [Cereibacter azotoformans]|uniref:sigma-70 family RNA polymerase sigma factor n=1 Tax=Cereibacter azotoformans TaxID=43057 RepID=UPI001EEB41D0|nr:sigma-70 family RNA polymerase sigma factor [Cereibacter azotoformans]ULB09179.1 sigma-70 family RNA polymerase sigma factor [Cereibacter azotoformans]